MKHAGLGFGAFGEAMSPGVQWAFLIQALVKIGAHATVQQAVAGRVGKTPEEALEMLEDLADPFLPEEGELFEWRNRYGVFYGGLMP